MANTIDRAGRLVIPKEIRDQLNWTSGVELVIVVEGEQVTIKRVDAEPSMLRRDGLLIHHGAGVSELDIADFVRDERERGAIAEAQV